MSEKAKNFWKEVLSYVISIAVAIVISFLFLTFVGQRSVVDGSSMETTLQDGDNLFTWKLGYRFHDPERFDIVVVHPYEGDTKTNYVKRVIGLPGETVQIIDGEVYINGEKLTEDHYCQDKILNAYTASEPIQLKEDEYFVMGDNRNASKDSRSEEIGPIPRSRVVGKAVCRLWPFDKIGTLGK